MTTDRAHEGEPAVPRPTAVCEMCEEPTIEPYVHPTEGIDFCPRCVAEIRAAGVVEEGEQDA